MQSERTVWAVLDARANVDPDVAQVFCTCETREEAEKIARRGDYGLGCVVMEWKEPNRE